MQQCLEHQEQDQGERLPLHVVGISNIDHCSKPLNEVRVLSLLGLEGMRTVAGD